MRIGVKVAVAHDLLHVDLDEEREELLRVDASGAKAFDVGYLDAVDVFHSEDPLRRVLADDAWDDDVVAVREGRGDGAHRLGFVQHIDFEGDVGGKLLVDGLERVVADTRLQPDEPAEDAEVGLDEPRAVRIDDLDGDLSAVLELGLVDLGEGRGGDWLRVELREYPLDRAAQLSLEMGLHLLPGMRGNLVLEAREDGGVFLGEDIRAAADRLADLDHESPEADNASEDALGAAPMVSTQAALVLFGRHSVLTEGKHLVAGQDPAGGGSGVGKAKDSVLAKGGQHLSHSFRGSGAPKCSVSLSPSAAVF